MAGPRPPTGATAEDSTRTSPARLCGTGFSVASPVRAPHQMSHYEVSRVEFVPISPDPVVNRGRPPTKHAAFFPSGVGNVALDSARSWTGNALVVTDNMGARTVDVAATPAAAPCDGTVFTFAAYLGVTEGSPTPTTHMYVRGPGGALLPLTRNFYSQEPGQETDDQWRVIAHADTFFVAITMTAETVTTIPLVTLVVRGLVPASGLPITLSLVAACGGEGACQPCDVSSVTEDPEVLPRVLLQTVGVRFDPECAERRARMCVGPSPAPCCTLVHEDPAEVPCLPAVVLLAPQVYVARLTASPGSTTANWGFTAPATGIVYAGTAVASEAACLWWSYLSTVAFEVAEGGTDSVVTDGTRVHMYVLGAPVNVEYMELDDGTILELLVWADPDAPLTTFSLTGAVQGTSCVGSPTSGCETISITPLTQGPIGRAMCLVLQDLQNGVPKGSIVFVYGGLIQSRAAAYLPVTLALTAVA